MSEAEALLAAVSRETREKLETFVDLLGRWQSVKNLVGPATLREVWTRHVADSLQLPPLAPGRRWLDLGSGAGFPGLVVAIACPDRQVTLVESNGRKCAFLREAARVTGVPTEIVNARLEEYLPGADRADVISARALAPLKALLDWTYPALTGAAIGLFPKGQHHLAELTDARESWRFAADVIPSVTDPDGRILRITELEPRAL